MTAYTDRGSGTPATTGATWASATNAVDGTPPANPATYATMTSIISAAVATIEIGGYDFSTVIGASDTLNSVTVRTRHLVNNTARFASVAVTCWDGVTQIGTSQALTLATIVADNDKTFTPTLAQLRSATFKIRVTVTGAASTQSRVWSLDHVDVVTDYTPLPPAITQAAYRFYADGTETGSVALAAQDTAYTADLTSADVSLLLRTRLQSTNVVAAGAADDWQLQYEKNANGTWVSIPDDALADSYAETNLDSAGSIGDGTTSLLGQAFLGNGQSLSRAGFSLRKFGAPTGNIAAYLYAHTATFGSNGKPGAGSSPLATSMTAVAASSLTSSYAWTYFTFDQSFTLVNGTPYVIVLGYSTGDGTNKVELGIDTSSSTHAGNASAFTTAWVASTFDVIFQVYAATATVAPFNSANLTDGAATTNRLGAGTGSFAAGKVSEDGLVDDLGWTANNYTEVLYAVTIKAAALANSDTLRFRVLRNAATTGFTYTQTPTIPITKTTAASTGKFKVWSGSAWVEKPVKVWTGSAWTEKPVKVWTGSAWVLA